jgi:ATP-binding cassette subfamily B protein
MNLRQLLSYASPYRRMLALCTLLMLAESAVTLALPWLGGRFAQTLLGSGGPTGQILALLLGLFAGQALLRFANTLLRGETSARILADLRTRIYDHLQALPLAFYQQRRPNDFMALVTYEVSHLAEFISGTLLSVLPNLLTAVGATILMFNIDRRLALLVVLLVPVFYLVLKAIGKRVRPLAQRMQQADAAAVAIADENLALLPTIKTFTREDLESERYGAQVGEIKSLSILQARLQAAIEPSIQLAASAGVVLLLWLASSQIDAGQLSAGELVSLLLYAAVLTRPIAGLAGIYGQTQMARGTLQRLQDVLDEPTERSPGGQQPLPPVKGRIEFRNVHFAYPGRPPVLHGFDLLIEAGETLAITGRNGAGKSTLTHLLMRLHELDAGQILIDGTDIATVGLRSLRSQIGVVAQQVLLFNGTVRHNIGMGLPGADAASIEAAARLAQAHDFIRELPEGYDTVIGVNGVRLSGGQRQRIALARALVKNPPILVLDEATAMFDPAAETSFVEACRASLASRTVILITHRPESLALAGRVVCLEAAC